MLRKNSIARRAYVRIEPAPGERFDVDWGHFAALVYNGATLKLYAFCLLEAHSRKMYLEFTCSRASNPTQWLERSFKQARQETGESPRPF